MSEPSAPSATEEPRPDPIEQAEDGDLVATVTAIIREADRAFQQSGGGTRHWVRDQFLPRLNSAGLRIASTPIAADGWQPIATAPTDGTVVLTCGSSWGICESKYTEDGWIDRETGGIEPTHWQPLPALPFLAAASAPLPASSPQADPWQQVDQYLNVGGFFNPEHMDHEKVRDMILALREHHAAVEAQHRAEVQRLTEEIARLTASRERVRESFGHRDADGKCLCVYCRRDVEGLVEHAADYELQWFTAIGRAEKAEAELARLKSAQGEPAASSPAQQEIDATWKAIERGWSIEPREYFEAEAPKNGFQYPLAQAIHHLWKRHRIESPEWSATSSPAPQGAAIAELIGKWEAERDALKGFTLTPTGEAHLAAIEKHIKELDAALRRPAAPPQKDEDE